MGTKESSKAYYSKNRDKILAKQKQRRLDNPEKYQQKLDKAKESYIAGRNISYHRKWRVENYEKCLLASSRRNAKIANVPFNLELSDIIIPDVCPLLKIPITKIQGEGYQKTNPSIDRIVPELGYVKGNIRIISNKANMIKQDCSKEELLTFFSNIEDYYK